MSSKLWNETMVQVFNLLISNEANKEKQYLSLVLSAEINFNISYKNLSRNCFDLEIINSKIKHSMVLLGLCAKRECGSAKQFSLG